MNEREKRESVLFFFFFSLFIYFEGGGGAEREGERESHSVSAEPDSELNLINHEFMTWAKIKSWTLT